MQNPSKNRLKKNIVFWSVSGAEKDAKNARKTAENAIKKRFEKTTKKTSNNDTRLHLNLTSRGERKAPFGTDVLMLGTDEEIISIWNLAQANPIVW